MSGDEIAAVVVAYGVFLALLFVLLLVWVLLCGGNLSRIRKGVEGICKESTDFRP